MHTVHILHPKSPRADALEAQASSWFKYASTCVFGCFKSESAFRFESIESSAVANSQALANLTPFDLDGQKGKCFPFWFCRIVVWMANRQVLADLVPSSRRFGWANRQVLADLVPSGRRFAWPNRKVLSDLNHSNRPQWQIGKHLPI